LQEDLGKYGAVRGPIAQEMIKLYPELAPYMDKNGNLYFELQKYMYGTDIASNRFYRYMINILVHKFGFTISTIDRCFLYLHHPDYSIYLAIHVDDILIVSTTQPGFDWIRLQLVSEWNVVWQQDNEFRYLGLRINRDRHTREIHLTMPDNITKVISQHYDGKTATSPTQHDLFDMKPSPNDAPADPTAYKSLVMTLMYIARHIRFDMLLAVNVLATHSQSPTTTHMEAALHLVRYLHSTQSYQLSLGGTDDLLLKLHADASHSVHPDGRGHGCIVVTFGNRVVHTQNYKLKHVTLSSTESEMSVCCAAAQFAPFLLEFAKIIRQPHSNPIEISQDNKSAILMTSQGFGSFQRSKHIRTKGYFVKEYIDEGILKPVYVPTADIFADLGTKHHNPPRLKTLLGMMHLGNPTVNV
jgi:hypothetical protein